jgi:hypothetical protein
MGNTLHTRPEELTDAEARIMAEQLLRLYAALLSRCRAKGKK